MCPQKDVSKGGCPLSTGTFLGSDTFVLGKHKQPEEEGRSFLKSLFSLYLLLTMLAARGEVG